MTIQILCDVISILLLVYENPEWNDIRSSHSHFTLALTQIVSGSLQNYLILQRMGGR